MERKQNNNQNQNQKQNEQRSNHNPNSSSSSSSSNPDSLFRNATLGRNIAIGGDRVNSVRDRMLNSLAIPGNLTSQQRDLLNPEQNRTLCVQIQETIAERFHQVSTNRTPNVQIQELLTEQRDRVSELAMTTGGCEYLQSVIAAEDGGVREAILAIVAADLPILMVHNIGSAFVRALFSACTQQQMDTVLESLFGNNEWAFFHICNNYHGSESAMTLIQNLKIEGQLSIVTNVLVAQISSFTKFEYCKNVLEFFIYTRNHNFSRLRLLINAMAKNCLGIAMNEIGSRVLQRSICPMFIDRGLVSSLRDAIVVNVLELAKDKYGNDLIQHVIDANIEGVTKRIVEALMGRFCDLAMNQFGSIVVQKCLRNCEPNEVVKIVEEFTNSCEQLPGIARDYFGHYVLVCALEHVYTPGTIRHFHNLVRGINRQVSTLKRHVYRKKVIEKIYELKRHSLFQIPQ